MKKISYQDIDKLINIENTREIDLKGFNLRGANMKGLNLRGANLSGLDFAFAILSKANLCQANLSAADLAGTKLSEAILSGANLRGANLKCADLLNADLKGANLIGANLNGANLSGTDLSSADLTFATLIGADLNGANLSGANLSEVDISETNLNHINLSRANLTKAKLNMAILSGAYLSSYSSEDDADLDADLQSVENDIDPSEINLNHANLTGASYDKKTKWPKGFSPKAAGAILNIDRDEINYLINTKNKHLSGLDLRGAYLNEADLSFVNLSSANLSRVNLGHANLCGADLSNANLRGTNLLLANLENANLSKADLSWAFVIAKNLNGANLNGAKYNDFTKWPSEFDPILAGAVLNISEEIPASDQHELSGAQNTSKFGQYTTLKPTNYRFVKEPSWFWTINPTTVSGELEIARLLSTERTHIGENGNKVTIAVTTIELAMREIAVTFGGTNIVGEDDKLILKSGATFEQVEDVLRQMPREMILELWTAVGDACPGWGPSKQHLTKLPALNTPDEQ